jgi:HAD superfamily hydrolase (TIGR01509 family)
LLDAYDTIVDCSFTGHGSELPALAGVAPEAWYAAYHRIEAALNAGQLSGEAGFAEILRACGAGPRPGLARELMDLERELLLTSARLYDDVLPFFETLRSRGTRVAIVSNCTEHTRRLLLELGVSELADALILSCEVRAAKPSARIFRTALDQLGVAAGAALFVDDQPAYCAGAAALGIGAVQIVRGERDGKAAAPGTPVVRSLSEVEAML